MNPEENGKQNGAPGHEPTPTTDPEIKPWMCGYVEPGSKEKPQLNTSGTPCRAKKVGGRKKCKNHGGKSLTGPDNPAWKHGKWSKSLPGRLAVAHQEALKDPSLLSLRHELALFDVRLGQLVPLLDEEGPGLQWSRLQAIIDKGEGDDSEILNELTSAIRLGATAWQRWDEVFRIIERRQKVAESERKRLVEMQQMVTNDQLLVLIGALTEIIRAHVPSAAARQAISNDLTRLLSSGVGE